jgi:hypothetical protein
MRLEDLKIGQTITHYCYGHLVEGKVIQTDGRVICTRHEPVRWGSDICTETWINPSSHLQFKWGGKNDKGEPAQGPHTTPAAFYQGEPLTTDLKHE